jgi:hypothetical protein
VIERSGIITRPGGGTATRGPPSGVATRTRRLQAAPARLAATLAARLSLVHTRRATLLEQLGFARWRLQREPWRRDGERLSSARKRDHA